MVNTGLDNFNRQLQDTVRLLGEKDKLLEQIENREESTAVEEDIELEIQRY